MAIAVLISVTGPLIMAGIWLLSSNSHPVFPLPSASTSAGRGLLPSAVTQTFIPYRSGLLVDLHALDYSSFSLTLITGPGNTKRHPKKSISRHTLPYSSCGVAVQFPAGTQDDLPQPTL